MLHDFGYFEEDQLGKPYDLRLLKRLQAFVRPYKLLLLLSVLLITLITLMDLAIPYVTKIAIDRYIVPSYRGENQAETGTNFQTESLAESRLYEVDYTDSNKRAIVEKYQNLFVIQNNIAVISYENLEKLNQNDILKLRCSDLKGVAVIAIVFLLIVLMNFGLNFVQVIIMEYTGQMIMHDLRMALFRHILDRSLSFFTRNPVGRLVTRVTNDVQNMNELFTSVITFIFKDLFLLIGIAAVLLWMNWKLALISFMVLPLVIAGSLHFSGKAREAFRILRIKVAEINTRFSETIGGIRVIQLFQQEKYNYKRFAHLNHENFQAGMLQIHILGLFLPFIELMGMLAIALVIYFGGRSVLAESISLGSLVAFISYMKMFFRPIRDIADKYNLLQNAMASAERIFLILDNTLKDAPEIRLQESQQSNNIETIKQIKFENISFSYIKGETVIDRVSFQVQAGEILAIVGPTGSGKTTLINLFPRFYEPDSGHISINGHDIRQYPITLLRSKMALVTQDPFLFSESIHQNIFNGLTHLSEKQKMNILIEANCEQMIHRFSNGLDTVLSEGGASISSGERQLISIARAVARNPELIILDEATSYIDSETEQQLQKAIANLMENRTSIVVAHRLTTARNANRILVMHHGRIIESGTHECLMQKKGFYFQLNQLQNKS